MQGSVIKRIQGWCVANCNGEWEHGYGIEISTLDNPGWSVRIQLAGTELATKPLEEICYFAGGKDDPEDRNWFIIRIQKEPLPTGPVFEGIGGPEYLERILEEFLKFAES